MKRKSQIKTMNFVQAFICSHRSQIKMFETIAILFVFFMLLSLGFIFYTRVQKTTIAAESEESAALNAIDISQQASFLHDIQCTTDNIPKDDCVDVEKVIALSSISEENIQYYYNLFGFSTIIVRQVYPSPSEWIIYDNAKQNFVDRTNIQLPVSIFYPNEERQGFGYFDVQVYR